MRLAVGIGLLAFAVVVAASSPFGMDWFGAVSANATVRGEQRGGGARSGVGHDGLWPAIVLPAGIPESGTILLFGSALLGGCSLLRGRMRGGERR